MKQSPTTYVLWIVFICLLLVLLPHTAWAFESMEPRGGKATAWIAAIAFESAIAVLVHKLAKHMEKAGKKQGWKRFSYMYLNAFSFGLLAVTCVSVLANLAHAVEFGTSLKIFTQWGIPQGLYSVAFGGILPVVSLLFARILSNVTESEEGANPELETAKAKLAEANRQLKESERQRIAAEQRANTAEDRFGAIADVVKGLFAEDKRERILTAKQWKPQLTGTAIAVITETSPAYVSEVLNGEVVEVK